MANDDDAWFAAKRYGIGAGLPIAWQGWMVLAAYLVVVLSAATLADGSPFVFGAILLVATAAFLPICAAKTRGGWRWHWGGD